MPSPTASAVARGSEAGTLALGITLAGPGKTVLCYEIPSMESTEHTVRYTPPWAASEGLASNGKARAVGAKYIELAATSGGEDYTPYIRTPYDPSLPCRTEADGTESTP